MKPIAPIHVMGHLLSEIRDVTDRSFPVDQAGHRVSLALRRFDDRSPIMVGDVVQSKRNTMPSQDVPDGDAEGDQGNWMRVSMGVYVTEAKPNRKYPESVTSGPAQMTNE